MEHDKKVLEEDALIKGLLGSKGKTVEIQAFGVVYAGILQRIDMENGTVTIKDGKDQAMLEIERIESFSPGCKVTK